MKKTAQKINATTQKFIEITDVVDDVVLLGSGQACQVIEVVATNFTLQSQGEQESKILSYASLLNSLSFSIQIFILSRELDVSSYIQLLDYEQRRSKNPYLAQRIGLYKDFVSQLVRVNTVLDKKFYITVNFSYLEKGAGGVSEAKNHDAFINDAKNQLHSKSSSIMEELARTGLKSKILSKDELIKVFYEIYNYDSNPGAGNDVDVRIAGGRS